LSKQMNEAFVHLLTFSQVGWPAAKMGTDVIRCEATGVGNTQVFG
jgi:hypothetical protein